MLEQTLNGLKNLRHSEHYPALKDALQDTIEEYRNELEMAPSEAHFRFIQGKIAAIRAIFKSFEDLDLLLKQWSKQDNPNVDPAFDKE